MEPVVLCGLDLDASTEVSKPDDYAAFNGEFDREKNPHLAIKLALSLNRKLKLAGNQDHLGEDAGKTLSFKQMAKVFVRVMKKPFGIITHRRYLGEYLSG